MDSFPRKLLNIRRHIYLYVIFFIISSTAARSHIVKTVFPFSSGNFSFVIYKKKCIFTYRSSVIGHHYVAVINGVPMKFVMGTPSVWFYETEDKIKFCFAIVLFFLLINTLKTHCLKKIKSSMASQFCLRRSVVRRYSNGLFCFYTLGFFSHHTSRTRLEIVFFPLFAANVNFFRLSSN